MAKRILVLICISLMGLCAQSAYAAPPQERSEKEHCPYSLTTAHPSVTVQDHFGCLIKAVIDWKTVAVPGVTAGASQLFTSHYGFSDDWSGYGKHYGVNVVGNVGGKFIGNFAIPALFHQDEQFVPLQDGSAPHDQFKNVFFHLFITRRADHSQPSVFNVSAIPGSAVNALLSNTYEPSRQRNAAATAQRFGWNIAGFVAGDAYAQFHCDLGKLVPWLKCRSRK